MTPLGLKAIERLKEGNRRFSTSEPGTEPPDTSLLSFSDLSAGQHPFAAVLACADSRVPVEAIFSQGAGSLFVVRVAGNAIDPPQLGSLEFAVGKLEVPLILVMGHSECGAIGAALAAGKGGPLPGGHLDALLDPVIGALERRAPAELKSGSLGPNEAVRLNVLGACEDLVEKSSSVAAKVESGDLLVAGAVYDLRTGRVSFLD